MRLIIVSSLFFLLLADFAAARNVDDMTAKLQVALKQGDASLALDIANDLYDISDKSDDYQSAGFSAYVKASILEQRKDYLAAAKAYNQCGHHYSKISSAAQSIQCQYKSGLAYLAGHKKGQAIDALKSTARSLEKIGQDRSELASQVYLTLSTETRPTKLDRSRGATRKRLEAAEYANKSITALSAIGQDKSESYVSALFSKGLALEDAEKFEGAVESYEEAIALYSKIPDHSDELLRNIRSRLSISSFEAQDSPKESSLDVSISNGETITLTIEKTSRVKHPRINENQVVDGARVRAQIQLTEGGKVDRIDVLESMPNPEYGDAFKKAVKKWKFVPPEGISSEDVPPFEYTMIFYVKRR